MMSPVFEPPTITVPFRVPLERWRTNRGVTVWKQNGTWFAQSEPFWGNSDTPGIKDADIVAVADRPGGECTDGTDRQRYLFLGARVYMVSANVAAELRAQGYEVGDVAPGGALTIDSLVGTVDALVGTVDGL